MRALYFDGQPCYRTEQPEPVPPTGEVLVRVRRSGICATDREIFKGYMGFTGIPGHEFVGQVAGPEGSNWLGKRVVAEINCGCGRCARCHAGDPRHCPDRTVLGIAGRNGAFAEYLVVPETCLHEVPTAVPDDDAVFVEPIAAAGRILEQIPDLPAAVLVIGDGKLGLLIAQVLATRATVTLLCHHRERAERVCGPSGIRCQENLSSDTRYRLVVEASGASSGLAAAVAAVEPEGTIVLKSTYAGRPPFDFSLGVVVPEVTIRGSRCGPFPPALALLEEGRIRTSAMTDGVFELDQWEEAFRCAARPETLKVIFRL